MQSKAKTVIEYLKELPEDRRKAIKKVRATIKAALPKGYKETMQYGMITYIVPLSIYPRGYGENKEVPLPYLSLASQKNYMALYLMGVYAGKKSGIWFQKEYKKTGKRLDMGKGCVRFKTIDDLPLELIAETVSLHTPQEWSDIYAATRKK